MSTMFAVLATLARGRQRNKRHALEQALSGRVRPHQRFVRPRFVVEPGRVQHKHGIRFLVNDKGYLLPLVQP